MKHELPPLPEPFEVLVWTSDGHAGCIQGHDDSAMTTYGEQVAKPLLAHIAAQRTELIALTGDNERLQRRIAELEKQLAGIKEVNKYYSDHCNVIANEHMQYQRHIALLEAQLASEQALAQRTLSDIQIEAAVRAWFSAARSDLPREQDFANRMRTAIDAASGTKI
jgi:chromosome segregation ATPase